MIIPSIDIMDGKVVQLKQGKEKVYENSNIEDIINMYKIFPEINVIDLDSAMGKGSNKELIKKICREISCNVGGGIRNIQIAQEYIDSGANSVIIGTRANKEFLSKLPREKAIVALDVKDGKIAVNGWQNLEEEDIYKKMVELEDYCRKYLVTNVDVEGLNSGTNLEFFKSLIRKNQK